MNQETGEAPYQKSLMLGLCLSGILCMCVCVSQENQSLWLNEQDGTKTVTWKSSSCPHNLTQRPIHIYHEEVGVPEGLSLCSTEAYSLLCTCMRVKMQVVML